MRGRFLSADITTEPSGALARRLCLLVLSAPGTATASGGASGATTALARCEGLVSIKDHNAHPSSFFGSRNCENRLVDAVLAKKGRAREEEGKGGRRLVVTGRRRSYQPRNEDGRFGGLGGSGGGASSVVDRNSGGNSGGSDGGAGGFGGGPLCSQVPALDDADLGAGLLAFRASRTPQRTALAAELAARFL